jgi:hypothetical protein
MSSRLKDILTEGHITNSMWTGTRAISLVRVNSLLNEFAPKLEKKEQEKLADAYAQLEILVESLNKTPYSIFNQDQWRLLNLVLMGKVAELQLVVEDIAEKNKDIDYWPLAKAIETILI